MVLRERDIEILKSARDDSDGNLDLDRNHLLNAFKRAGAVIVKTGPGLRVQFKGSQYNHDLPLGRGPVDLTGRHKAFRVILRDPAADLLIHCGID